MDDFLHNLRSGKLKQPDRTRREYTDHNKAPQQQQNRSGYDRRRGDYYAKITNEHFMVIKQTMDAMVENQKKVLDAIAVRDQTLSRVARSLEAMVAMVGRKWGYADLIPPVVGTSTDSEEVDPVPNAEPVENSQDLSFASPDNLFGPLLTDMAVDDEDLDTGEEEDEGDMSSHILDIISAMREDGESWKKIADHFDERQIPALAGREKWTGPAVKKFWEAGFPEMDEDNGGQ
ncbi:hypothetical protein LJC71_05840 [Desulfosarcina sp. OttesenSCG-928-A07]|nr:hypothetical protein [Desulfosarcina sp. OttesenSCG-928-G17]MDL2329250.1 hypothetical protein [Desulfosarcina sp. OttesenSCG-928-A07]